MRNMKDVLVYLGAGPSTTSDEIELLLKKAAQKHHPDRGGDKDEFLKAREAMRVFKKSTYVCPECNGAKEIRVRVGKGGYKVSKCSTCTI